MKRLQRQASRGLTANEHHMPHSQASVVLQPTAVLLLHVCLQVLLDERLAAAGKPLVAVGALLFAPPNVGNDAFVTEYNKRVNARR
jgi:hypothetical protein